MYWKFCYVIDIERLSSKFFRGGQASQKICAPLRKSWIRPWLYDNFLQEVDMETRADKMLQQADKIGCKKFVRPKVIKWLYRYSVSNEFQMELMFGYFAD